MKKFTLKDWQVKTQEAYSRLKAYIYYDNFNLTLRAKLAEYEFKGNLDNNLNRLANDIYSYSETGKVSNRILNMIKESSYFVVPKSFKSTKDSLESNKILISNKHDEKFIVDKTTKLLAGDIELQIIGTLWIMIDGVRLGTIIGPDSYGYHLPMDENELKLRDGKVLFTKYFEKYQEWRDKGIKAAKNQIEEGNNVLLISLDIQNFFHSARINFSLLRKNLKSKKISLTTLIERICCDHTEKLQLKLSSKSFPILPIGFVASGVIANWFLSQFDLTLKKKLRPVYYGRYVDDFFIVLSNVSLNIEENSTHQDQTSKLINWMCDLFFKDGTPLKISEKGNNLELSFSDKNYEGLKIQAEKLKLFYFSPEWPQAILNNFQKTIEENSSAFWFLPEEEELKGSLDEKAYDMQYEDTINKFRSISNIKASKYGASVFLAKRIKLAILNSGPLDEKVTKEIFRFFKGLPILDLYTMWEKVFSYFVVVNDKASIQKLHKLIHEAIVLIPKGEDIEILKESLIHHLDVSLSLALSLNPDLVNSVFIKKTTEREKIIECIKRFRSALLTRHHYLPFPSIILTDYYIKTLGNLLFKKTSDIFSYKIVVNELIRNNSWRIPRWIYLQEICMLKFMLELSVWDKRNNAIFFHDLERVDGKMTYSNKYTDYCIKLFKDLNHKDLSRNICQLKFKIYSDSASKYPRIFSNEISIRDNTKSLKLKLGLSNFNLHEVDLRAAIIDHSLLTKEKRSRHIKLLNKAEEEGVELLILPETSVPFGLLYAYADESRRKNRAFIFGLEHFTINDVCFNFSVGLFPFESGTINEVFILPRLKNHYSPHEQSEIKKVGKCFPKITTSLYNLIKWKGLQFTIYNCYELTDLVHRSIFRSELDILFAIEYNRDVNYFSNIAESTCRDLHCYFVQANTAKFGDSRIIEPSETEKMNPVRVKGGENDVILKYEIDIEKLRDFQFQRLPYQISDKSFKTTPPDFNHAKVKTRGDWPKKEDISPV